MVINAVKDVAAALGELINATKLASGKPIQDPAMQDLKETARVSEFPVSFFIINFFFVGCQTYCFFGDPPYEHTICLLFIFFSMILTKPSI